MEQKKITFGVVATYRPTWGVWEGVREIAQNWMDAQLDGHRGTLHVAKHRDRTVTVTFTNEEVIVPTSALYLGESSKADRDDRGYAGKFGEGLTFGLLALTREGIKVTVRTGGLVWKPAFVTVAGKKLFEVRFSKERCGLFLPGIDVVIEHLPEASWETFKSRLLKICRPEDGEQIRLSAGRILLSPRFSGQIFVKGIFVRSNGSDGYGYDLDNVSLDMERKLMDSYEAEREIRALWHEAVATHKLSPAQLYDRMCGPGEHCGARWSEYHVLDMPIRVKELLLEEFHNRHGTSTIACASEEERGQVEYLGETAVVVPSTIATVFSGLKGKPKDLMSKLARSASLTHQIDQLAPEERTAFETARSLVLAACPPARNARVEIVSFRDQRVLGACFPHEMLIHIDRRALQEGTVSALRVLVHEAAHLGGEPDGAFSHTQQIEKIWSAVAAVLLQKSPPSVS